MRVFKQVGFYAMLRMSLVPYGKLVLKAFFLMFWAYAMRGGRMRRVGNKGVES